MKRLRLATGAIMLASLLHTGPTGAEEPGNIRDFTAESFDRIKESFEGQPFVLALWSVDCPPCLVELDMLGQYLKDHPDLPLVLVSTDSVENKANAKDFLADFDLDGIDSWMFADDYTARLRYSIDPGWYGELPRSYFFDEQHERHAHSGTMTRSQLEGWLSP